MNKHKLDLRFLYQKPLIRDYDVMGIDFERRAWDKKYEKGEDKFRNFIRKCSLENFIYIYINIFTEKFPNVLRLAFTFSGNLSQPEEQINEFNEFDRSDITSLITKEYIGPIKNEFDPGDRDIYETKLSLEFKKSFPLDTVEEALEGLTYTKTKENDTTIYEVEDSPIKTLEVTNTGFTININEDKVVLYYKL
ncbi:hypothetical protein [Pontimicrobium sp. MEBiC01747]